MCAMPKRKRSRGPRGEGTVYRDGDGWRAAYPLGVKDGKRIVRRARARTEAEALDELERMRRAYGSGSRPARETVDAWLEQWLRDHGPDVRPSTLTSYEGHVRLHISPLIGGIQLARLQPADVRRLKADRLAAGLSPATVARIMTTLRMAIGQAVRDRVIPDNPADAVRLPRVQREPVEALTEDRAEAIIEAVRGSHIEVLVTLLLGSGLRLGEALGLDWRDVDLKEGFVIVRRSKTHERAVPISEDAKDALAVHRLKTVRRGFGEAVFRSPRRSRRTRQLERLRGDTVTHMFPRLLESTCSCGHGTAVHVKACRFCSCQEYEAEPLPRMRVHDLRHGVATLLVAKGVHMRVIAEQLGHANPALTARTYSHIVPQQQRDAIALLGRRKGA